MKDCHDEGKPTMSCNIDCKSQIENCVSDCKKGESPEVMNCKKDCEKPTQYNTKFCVRSCVGKISKFATCKSACIRVDECKNGCKTTTLVRRPQPSQDHTSLSSPDYHLASNVYGRPTNRRHELTAFIPTKCKKHLTWAHTIGKVSTKASTWYSNMRKVTGVDIASATMEDFQRLFKCDGIQSEDCNNRGLKFPKSCTVPPCSKCSVTDEEDEESAL